MDKTRLVEHHPLGVFFGLVYLLAWAFWIPLLVLRTPAAPGAVFLIMGCFAPSLAGLILTGILDGRTGLRDLWRRTRLWRVGLHWYAAVLFGTAAVAEAAILLHVALGGPAPGFGLVQKYGALLPAIFLQVLLLGGPLQEEFGWRGFALPRLLANHSAAVASLIIGLLWGLWHLPLFGITWSNQYDFPLAWYLLYNLPLAFLFSWIYVNTRGSLLLALLFHAAFNTTVTILPIAPQAAGTPRILHIAVGLLWLIAGVILTADRGRCLGKVPARVIVAKGAG